MEDICMVSVCCAAYNHEKYIRKALDSILGQKTDFKFEILIHDDASTDGTTKIIREYEEKYPDIIKPIYQTENQYSKNVKITNVYQFPRAKGKYIAFCGCDDFWTDEHKLQKQVDFLEENLECVACVHKYVVVDEGNNEKNVATFGHYENGGVYTFKDFFEKELPGQIATLVMRNIVMDEKKGYPQQLIDINIPGDIKLNLWLLIHGDIYRMEDVMSAYRFVHKKGGTSYSSRICTVAFNYGYWCQLCEMEKVLLDVYGLQVYLKKRRLLYALGTVTDLRKGVNFQNLKNALKVLIKQKGTFETLLKQVVRSMKKRFLSDC